MTLPEWDLMEAVIELVNDDNKAVTMKELENLIKLAVTCERDDRSHDEDYN
jgi:hypothetical protein